MPNYSKSFSISNVGRFLDAIANAGLGHPEVIPDGELHRFTTVEDKRNEKSGWYVLHLDPLAGSFGDWRSGIKEVWRPGAEKLTPTERKAFADMKNKARRKRAAEEHQRHEKVAVAAQEMVARAATAMWHPYLKSKRVLPFGIRQHNDQLVIPMMDTTGKIWSAQTICVGGTKRFLKGGRKKGVFHLIGGPVVDHFYICEGFATGATIHMHLDPHAPVFVAFDAGNLKPVAQALRKHYPGIRITVAADNDCWGAVNTGLEKGRQAATVIGAELTYPTFENVDTSSRPTDFNDLYRLGGL